MASTASTRMLGGKRGHSPHIHPKFAPGAGAERARSTSDGSRADNSGIARDADDRWSLVVFAAVAAAAVLGLAATSLGVAGALGNFFDDADPFLANLTLTAVSAFPIALALAAWAHARQLRGASRELRRLSKTDTLTGLPNRAALNDVLDRAFGLARGPSVQTAALFCDLDRFKLVNDTYGHEVGDRLMQDV